MANIGRMTQARARRAISNPNEIELWCLDYFGTVVRDGNGTPVAVKARCKNRECCPPRRGMMALHVWDIVTGEFTTEWQPDPRAR